MDGVSQAVLCLGRNADFRWRNRRRLVSLLLVLLVAHFRRVDAALWVQVLPILDPIMQRPRRLDNGVIGQVLLVVRRLKLEKLKLLLTVEGGAEYPAENDLLDELAAVGRGVTPETYMRTGVKPVHETRLCVFHVMAVSVQGLVGRAIVQYHLNSLDASPGVCVEVPRKCDEVNLVYFLGLHASVVLIRNGMPKHGLFRKVRLDKIIPVAEVVIRIFTSLEEG
jgi:hypothetical protein